MKRSEAMALVSLLEGAYPWPMGDAVGVYVEYMLGLDAAQARDTVVTLIAECEKRPTIAEILSRCAERQTGIPSAEAAWAEVSMAIRSGRRTMAPEFSHPMIAQVVREMSWYGLCSSSTLAADRAAFRERYRELRAETVRTVQHAGVLASPAVRGLLGGGK